MTSKQPAGLCTRSGPHRQTTHVPYMPQSRAVNDFSGAHSSSNYKQHPVAIHLVSSGEFSTHQAVGGSPAPNVWTTFVYGASTSHGLVRE